MSDHPLLTLTADIVSAHVSHNPVAAQEMPALIRAVGDALERASLPKTVAAVMPEPPVPIRQSVRHDYIICLEDGAKLKMLKRYLRTHHNMTPEQYRAKWRLPRDYPMVAPDYAARRTELAKKIGLGRRKAKPGSVAEA